MDSDHSWSLHIAFHPPDLRRRDIDNLLASLKSAIDGICDAWQIDDSRFRRIALEMMDKVKGGKVVITACSVVE